MIPDSPKTILILEDDEGVARLQQRSLERAGFAVRCATASAEAMEQIRRGGIDLLILDNRLSATETGLDFYKHMKASGHDLPVIMVTGYSDDATIIEALRAGVRDYVFKSVEYLAYVPEAVQRVLEQEQTKQQHRRALADLQAKSEELRSTTQQLWQAAKLAGVGELAASIAHELNNPLGTVSLRVESLLAKTPPDDPRRKALEIVEQEVERMGRLVGNLLQFSRAGREQVSTVDVCEEVLKTIELTEHHLRKRNVRIATDFHPGVPIMYADRQHLRQVFLNLFTNAGDAMHAGGTLTIRVKPNKLETGKPAVIIEVVDTGIGIAPEHLPRVTEAFFTTKEEGKGTGLGLAICRRIVQEHHGLFQIESEPGKGTTVRITLPLKNGSNLSFLPDEPIA